MTDSLLTKYGTRRNGHAIFSPSGSYGWLYCAGYLLANALADDDAGFDAAYGTVAHGLAQGWNEGVDPTPRVGEIVKVRAGGTTHEVTIDADMLFHVKRYIDWCSEVTSKNGVRGDVYVEKWVSTSRWMPIPDQGGTADFFVCYMGLLEIVDLKMGIGVPVAVERNPQAMIYALGVFDEWDFIYHFEKIVIRICQPRLDYFGVWECSREELLAFGEFVRERAALAWQEDAPRTPSTKSCRFCKVKKGCPAISMHLETLADDSFDTDEGDEPGSYDPSGAQEHEQAVVAAGEPGLPEPTQLSTAFLAYRLSYRKLYESWFKAIYDELEQRAERGETIKGFHLGRGRRSFEWADEEAARKLLRDAGLDDEDVIREQTVPVGVAKTGLIRLAKMKPKEADEYLKSVITIKPGRPSLVPSTDRRPDINDEVDDSFETED